VLRGEIYLVDFGLGVGREYSGTRPAVVVTNDVFNTVPVMVTVVPGEDATTNTARAGLFVPAVDSGLQMDVQFLPFQIRALDPGRFPAAPSGILPTTQLSMLTNSLKVMLGI
jgi:mRNA interferase MazF